MQHGADETSQATPGLLGVFDLETTGVDVRLDRIVTAHIGLLGAEGQIMQSRTWLADPGIDIPTSATAIHGISTATAQTDGRPAPAVVAEIIDELRTMFSRGIPVVAFNAPFDFSVLKYEAARHSLPPLESPSPVLDPLVLDRAHDRYRRGKRTLEAVAAHYEVPLTSAHDAAADAIAAGRVAQALLARFKVTVSAAELHRQQVAWAQEQAESLSDYLIRSGRLPSHERIDGTWPVQ